MTVIVGLLQFVGATVILVYGVEESHTLVNELNEYLIKLVHDWDNDPKAAAVLKQIMEYVSDKADDNYPNPIGHTHLSRRGPRFGLRFQWKFQQNMKT